MKSEGIYLAKIMIFFIDLFLIFVLFLNILHFFSITTKEILSASMEPTICTGDVVYINLNVPYDSIKTGDIIAYQNGNMMVVHRVIEVGEDGLITKGDNSNEIDINPVNEKMYMGRIKHWMKSGSDFYEFIGTGRFQIFSAVIILITFIIV